MLKGEISRELAIDLCRIIKSQLPRAVAAALTLNEKIKGIAKKLCDAKDIFYIGRGIDYDLCAEASLKLKEISYIHSEAYAAGELKHGTISLITDGTPVICIMTDSSLKEKMQSNMREVIARGARVTAICTPETENACPLSSEHEKLVLPSCDELLYPFLAAVVAQLLAYHVAALNGLDVDKPRNLAKSVTVE